MRAFHGTSSPHARDVQILRLVVTDPRRFPGGLGYCRRRSELRNKGEPKRASTMRGKISAIMRGTFNGAWSYEIEPTGNRIKETVERWSDKNGATASTETIVSRDQVITDY